MSLILEALRRGRGIKTIERATRTAARPEAILAAFGYGPQPHQRRSVRGWVWVASAAVVLVGAGATVASKYTRSGTTAAVVTTAMSAPAASDTAKPERGLTTAAAGTTTKFAAPPAPALQAATPEPRAARALTPVNNVNAMKSVNPNVVNPMHPLNPTPVNPVKPVNRVTPPGREISAMPASRPDADHFKLALYHQRAGNFEKALVHYRALLEANELNAEAHNNLGLLYQQKGLIDEAIREFERATFIDPKYRKARNNLGVALLRARKVDAAIAEFRAILAAEPKDVDALVNLAVAVRAAGSLGEAQDALLRALGLDGANPLAHYNLALVHEQQEQIEKALEHYRAFLKHAGSEHADVIAGVRTRVDTLASRLIQP